MDVTPEPICWKNNFNSKQFNSIQNFKQCIVRESWFFQKKGFDFDWDRTRVPTLASSQRWPLGHTALIFSKNVLILIINLDLSEIIYNTTIITSEAILRKMTFFKTVYNLITSNIIKLEPQKLGFIFCWLFCTGFWRNPNYNWKIGAIEFLWIVSHDVVNNSICDL